ncbi:hypothetical protein H180DRAFT_00513 [Streptomyces sp. WMMB 322]|nr:hypothetical protein H180DRAFT_00513 [Streptomyces sp. WMMB 322]
MAQIDAGSKEAAGRLRGHVGRDAPPSLAASFRFPDGESFAPAPQPTCPRARPATGPGTGSPAHAAEEFSAFNILNEGECRRTGTGAAGPAFPHHLTHRTPPVPRRVPRPGPHSSKGN